MPVDPRMIPAPSSPSSGYLSASAGQAIYTALLDLSRRIDTLAASRTQIDPSALDGAVLAPGAVDTPQLHAGAVTASIIGAGAITALHMSADSITVGNGAIKDLTVTTAKIQDGAIQTAKIGDLQVTTAKIGNQQVDTAQIKDLAVNNAKIATGTIDVAKINVATITDLSTLATDTGTLKAGLIKTDDAPNARIEIGTVAGGIKGYNSSNALTFGFDVTTGAATVGSITVTGAGGTAVPASTLTGFVGGGNLVRDSSFESADPATPASLWTTTGVTAVKVNAATSFHGSKLLMVTYASGTASTYTSSELVVNHGVPATSLRSRPYVASVWVWVDTTATTFVGGGTNACLMVFDGTNSPRATITNLTKGQWNRVVVKGTVAAGATAVTLRLYNPYTNGPVYYDALQFEFGDAPTSYSPKADEILYGKITTVELAVGAVKATNLDAGAVTADKISLGVPQVVSIINGQFNAGNPADGTVLGNGWTPEGPSAATVQTDVSFNRTARIVHGSLSNSDYYQVVTLPVGRHILRGWCKTTTVVLGTGQGAGINAAVGTATATITTAPRLTGTNAWTLLETIINVTVAGTVTIYGGILGFAGSASGTAEFANVHLIPAITGTTLTPTAIDAMTITGATFQTASSGARSILDAAGLRYIDAAAVTTVNLSATTGGLTILASSTDSPPDSRKLRFLHSTGTTASEFTTIGNSTTTPTFINPSFTTDLSSWSLSPSPLGTITRDTVTFDSSPGAMKFSLGGPESGTASTVIQGTFKAGFTYRIPFSFRTVNGGSISFAMGALITGASSNQSPATWTRTYFEYKPTADITNPTFQIGANGVFAGDAVWFDTFGPIEIITQSFWNVKAKTGGVDAASISLGVTDASSVSSNILLFNDKGASGFLQLASAAKRVVNYGSATASWPGGTAASGIVTITHGLGATPTNIQVTPANTSGTTSVVGVVVAGSLTSTQFQVYLESNGGGNLAATTRTFYWQAVV